MHGPLSEQLRPGSFNDIVGQEHLLGPEGLISTIVARKKPLSIILWGPPGTGKTSIARLYAKAFSLEFRSLSAIFSGISDLKKLLKEGEDIPLFDKPLLLFVDEIHRFNKAQQDAFLPYLESGKLILVGATAENPSFYLNKALLSRVRVLVLKPLTNEALEKILASYEAKKAALPLSSEAKEYLIQLSAGDGRYLLNLIENIEGSTGPLQRADVQKLLQAKAPLFDKNDDQHYNLISALHKSVRGSDPEAALYWLQRMLIGGEDPLFLARRLIRMALEDIGLADPGALQVALNAKEAYEMLGSPEGELALAEAVIYLSLSPKSNAIYTAFNKAKDLALASAHLSPPRTILNAPTALMKEQGYGRDYIYDHDTEEGFSGQNYFPEGLQRTDFYQPVSRGFEREMKKRLAYFAELRQNKASF